MTTHLPVQNFKDILVDRPVMIAGVDRPPVQIDLTSSKPDYVTDIGTEVWLERKKQRTRFLDRSGNQVGPWHSNLVPAIIWARYHGWVDPTLPDWFNQECIDEVRANSQVKGSTQ